MSESYSIIPLNREVREWLAEQGLQMPENDGKQAILSDLKKALDSCLELSIEWLASKEFEDAIITSKNGLSTMIISGDDAESIDGKTFHFRGGNLEIIKIIVSEIAKIKGPQVIHAHSGGHTEVVCSKNA